MRTIFFPHTSVQFSLRFVSLLTAKLLMPLLLLGCGVNDETSGQEFGVVTSEHGYIVAEDDKILETLDTFAVVDIQEEVDGILIVKSAKGTIGRMPVEELHRSSWFELITPENSAQIRKAVRQIEIAHSGAAGKLSPIEQMQAGLDSLEAAIGADNTGYAWVLCYLAFMQTEDGDLESAQATLARSQKILEDLDAMEFLHAADFYNVRAVMNQNEGSYDAAISDYQKAIEISTKFLGDIHMDLRVVHSNLANACFQNGEIESAIQHQQQARGMGAEILPADVIERINDNRNLALYLTEAERFEEAKTLLLEAKLMLEASASPDLAMLIETGLDLGQCYYSLNENLVARRRLEEIVTVLNENESLEEVTGTDVSPLRIRAHMLLGLVESAVQRDEAALAHHEKAISYSSPESPDFNAARAAQEAGDAAQRLGRLDVARKSYKLSIAIYTALEGDDGDNVTAVKELLAALDGEMPAPKPSGDAASEYVLVTGSRGFLTDTKGAVVAIVPGLSLLEVAGTTDDSFYVHHEGRELLIRKELVRTGTLLPSYGVMTAQDAKPFYDKLAKARQLQFEGDLPAAHGAFIAVIDELSQQVGVDNPFYVMISCSISTCAAQQGGLGLAEQILDRQADYLKQLDQEGNPVIVDVLAVLSYIRLLDQRYDESASLMQKAIEIQKLIGLQDSAEFAIPEYIMIAIDFQKADFKSALKRQERVTEIVSRSYPHTSIDYAEALSSLGMAQLMNDPQGKGLDLMAEAVKIAEAVPKPEDRVAGLKQSYGLFLKFTGNNAEARRYLSEALDEFRGRDRFLELSMKLNALSELADIAASEGKHRDAIKLGEEGLAVVSAAREQYSVAPKITAEIAERLHDILIVSYENSGDSRNAKKYSDLLAKLKADNATLKATPDGVQKSNEKEAMSKDGSATIPPSQKSVPSPVKPAPGKSASGDYTAESLNFQPSHEFMLITTQATSLQDAPNGQEIMPIGKSRKLWSLESTNGWSRVRIPGKDGFGWLNQQHAAELNSTLIQTTLQELLTEAAAKNLDVTAIGNKAEEAMFQFQEAQQLFASGDADAAVSRFETALKGSREVLGENNPLSAMVNTELVGAYVGARQFSRARTLLETTQPITKKTFGDNHPRVAVDAWRMASLLSLVADLRGAAEQLQAAIKVADAAYGREDVRAHVLRSDLAQILIQQGQLDQAEAIMNEIVRALATESTVNHPLRAQATAALGVIAFHREKYADCVEFSASAEKQFEALGPSFTVARGQARMFRGLAMFRQSLFKDAEAILDQAESDLKSGGSQQPGLQIQLALLQSTIEFINGNMDVSLERIDEALNESLSVYGSDHISSSYLHVQKASILAAQEKIDDARVQFNKARESVFRYVDQTLADLPVREQTAFLRLQDKRELDRALSMSLRDSAEPNDHELTATWLLNARNLPHELSARTGQVRRLLQSRAQNEAYEKYRAARERLATMPTGNTDDQERLFREEERTRQQEQMQVALKSLPTEVQQQIELQAAQYVQSRDVRKALQDDETLVEIIRMTPVGYSPEEVRNNLNPETRQPEEYVAWILPPYRDGAAPNRVSTVVRLGNAKEIDEQVSLIQQAMLQS
jgi:tetratricopeptide (TPR) repeat protein